MFVFFLEFYMINTSNVNLIQQVAENLVYI